MWFPDLTRFYTPIKAQKNEVVIRLSQVMAEILGYSNAVAKDTQDYFAPVANKTQCDFAFVFC
jgi:hypothetical protein